MNQKIRWGVLGTAAIAEGQVIPAIKQSRNGEVTAVGSRNLERAKAYAFRNGISKAYGSYEELITDPEIDAIYNPLPNAQHGEWSLRCAEAGKPVLCEKPLSSTADEARRMAAAFDRRGLLLAEAFMYRFHPQTQTIKELVDNGAVGKIHFVDASFCFSISSENDIRLQKAEAGGALMDVGCYCLSAIHTMLGEEPVQVSAMAVFGEKSEVDERLVGLLLFASGVLAHFDCSLRTHFTQRYDIRGTHGRILTEQAYVPFRPDPTAKITVHTWKSTPGIEKEQYQAITITPINQYALMVEDFADALLQKRPPRFSVEDSIHNMQTIERLLAAARS